MLLHVRSGSSVYFGGSESCIKVSGVTQCYYLYLFMSEKSEFGFIADVGRAYTGSTVVKVDRLILPFTLPTCILHV